MTADEQAIYDAAFKDALLPEVSDECHRLFIEWKAKEKTIESTELLAHADILYDILKAIFLSRKDEIMTDLANKIKNASNRHSLNVKLFRFQSVEWIESLSDKKRRQSLMTPLELMKETDDDVQTYEEIRRNHWDWSLGTMSSYGGYADAKFPYKSQARLHRIIKKTPILNWLSGLLGPNYQCFLESKYQPHVIPDQNFYVIQNSIRICYLPYGHKKKATLLQIAKDCNEKNNRISYKLSADETLYGNGSWDLESLTNVIKD